MQRAVITTFLEEVHKQGLFDTSNLFLQNVQIKIFSVFTLIMYIFSLKIKSCDF